MTRVTGPLRGVVDQFKDWAPGGRKLVFERKLPCPAGGPRDGLDNTCDRQTAGGYHYLTSAFSPDRKQIVSATSSGADRNRHGDLVVMRADGSRLHPITDTALWESSVDWRPRQTR